MTTRCSRTRKPQGGKTTRTGSAANLQKQLDRRTRELAKAKKQLAEMLQQQTATSEVLRVISSSQGELQPVFDSLLENAVHVCGASFGTMTFYEDRMFRTVALHQVPEAYLSQMQRSFRPHPKSGLGRVASSHSIVQITDLRLEEPYLRGDPAATAMVDLAQARTIVIVPMLRDKHLVGAIAIFNQQVRRFTDRQIELLNDFAKQAVIAIENARLLNELSESLQQQTATSEVLRVINSSPGELAPVFDAMLERAMRLCEAAFGGLWVFEGDRYVAAALRGVPPAYASYLARTSLIPGPQTAPYRFLHGERSAIQNVDLAAEEPYRTGDPQRRALVDLGRARTALQVPLVQDETALGVITVYRQEVRPFSEKQVTLLQDFAAQAVIAMENARLFNETKEALAQQTATGDVLKIISRSSVDLETVLNTLVETVARLCHADQAVMWRRRDDLYHIVAWHGLPEEAKEFVLTHPVASGRGTVSGRAALERRPIHVSDVVEDPEYTYNDAQKLAGYRSLLSIPLLREDALIGIFSIHRTRVDPFTSKEIELASSFADQAVIAIENARLFEELRERQAELRVTFDNMGDAVVMFDADARLAAWNRNFQELLDLPGAFLAGRPSYVDYFRYLADRGEYSSDLEEELSRTVEDPRRELRFERTRPDGRIIEVRRNPVPDGGFVMIYADVTERKRAEEAIRSARDAAEKALRELQTAQDRLVQTQKLASLGQLTAGIAHEIKNPLNFVNNFSALSVELADELNEVLKQATLTNKVHKEVDELTALLKDNLDKVIQHGKRADSIVKNMLLHSREGSREQTRADINALVDESLNLAYHGARAERSGFEITLQRDFDASAGTVELFPQEINRALLNLISNGFYAASKRKAEDGGAGFEPTVLASTRNLGNSVEIRIRDNGTGIRPEVREKMFNPFFTTKPTGDGTGLGLSITHDIIVKQHGGRIDVETEPGVFTEFIITLPRGDPLSPKPA